MAMHMLSKEFLHEELVYDPSTGFFFWRISKQGRRTSKIAGNVCKTHGYVSIRIKNTKYYAHRLAYVYIHGEIDDSLVIDHINGNRSDNRICNLRLVTPAENSKNIEIKRSGTKLSKFLSHI